MQKARLEGWAVVRKPRSPYAAPEDYKLCLAGKVYDHPELEDGKQVTTSSVVSLHHRDRKATTRNTEYELGEPYPEYREMYPQYFDDEDPAAPSELPEELPEAA